MSWLQSPLELGNRYQLRFRVPEFNRPYQVVVYFHGNADQIGWGGAYVGALLRDRKVRHSDPSPT